MKQLLSRLGRFCAPAGAWLMIAGCDAPIEATALPPSTITAATATSAPPAASSPGALASPMPSHIARARDDTLERYRILQRHPLVDAAYPPAVKRVLEQPDEVILYSATVISHEAFDAVFAGDFRGHPTYVGSLPLTGDQRRVTAAWLFDGMTRPFDGLRCKTPHHALRFRRDKDVVAINICFECGTWDMRTTFGPATTRSAYVRWDPGFRNYLKHLLESASIRDYSSDMRP